MAQDAPRSVVPVILSTVQGALILQRRDHSLLGVDYLRGKWSFFGGHCEDGETPEATAVREIFEELELRLDTRELKAFGAYQKQKMVHGDNNFVYAFRYTKPVDPGSLVVHEGAGYAVVDKDNLMDTPLTVLTKQLVHLYFGIDKELEKYRVF